MHYQWYRLYFFNADFYLLISMTHLWNSLQFKIPAVFIVSFFLILIAVVVVFSTIGKRMLDKQAYEQVILSGQNIVSELGNRVALAESLALALANIGEQLPKQEDITADMVRHALDYQGTESFIAGGGIWPAPYLFEPDVERRSFFWGEMPVAGFSIMKIIMTLKAQVITTKNGMYLQSILVMMRCSGPSPTWIPTHSSPW